MFDRLTLGYSPNHVIDKISTYIRSKQGQKFDINSITDEYIIDVANSEFITKGKFTPSLRSTFSTQNQNNEITTDFTPEEPVTLNFQTPVPQPTNQAMPIGIPSEDSESFNEDDQGMSEEQNFKKNEDLERKDKPSIGEQLPEHLKKATDDELQEYHTIWTKKGKDGIHDPHNTLKHIENEIKRRENEASEEVDTCGCEQDDSEFNAEIPKQNIKKLENPQPIPTPKHIKGYHQESIKLSPQQVNQLLKENYAKKKQHNFKIEQRHYGI